LRIVAGSAQLGLPKSSFLKHSLPVPDIAEQDEIVSILYDLENELSELDKVLRKYEWLKQGVMHDLLTGRVRLV
jgi:type I restriction enzyme S subunit